jgi:hypothetical protein
MRTVLNQHAWKITWVNVRISKIFGPKKMAFLTRNLRVQKLDHSIGVLRKRFLFAECDKNIDPLLTWKLLCYHDSIALQGSKLQRACLLTYVQRLEDKVRSCPHTMVKNPLTFHMCTLMWILRSSSDQRSATRWVCEKSRPKCSPNHFLST